MEQKSAKLHGQPVRTSVPNVVAYLTGIAFLCLSIAAVLIWFRIDQEVTSLMVDRATLAATSLRDVGQRGLRIGLQGSGLATLQQMADSQIVNQGGLIAVLVETSDGERIAQAGSEKELSVIQSTWRTKLYAPGAKRDQRFVRLLPHEIVVGMQAQDYTGSPKLGVWVIFDKSYRDQIGLGQYVAAFVGVRGIVLIALLIAAISCLWAAMTLYERVARKVASALLEGEQAKHGLLMLPIADALTILRQAKNELDVLECRDKERKR